MSDTPILLVTGAAGFVGRGVVDALSRHTDYSIVAADRVLPRPKSSAYPPSVQPVILDVTDRTACQDLIASHSFSHIIAGAALTLSTEEEERRGIEIIDVNLIGLINLLAAVEWSTQPSSIIFLSSSGLYAQTEAGPGRTISEESELDLSNYYAATKRSAENLLQVARGYSGRPHVSLRLASVYGPGEVAGPSRPGVSLVAALLDALGNGRELRLAGANRVRDWVHVDDVARAIDAVIRSPCPHHHIYNVSSGQGTTFAELATPFERAGLEVTWVAEGEEADLVQGASSERTPLAIDRMVNEFDYRPSWELREGLNEVIQIRLNEIESIEEAQSE